MNENQYSRYIEIIDRAETVALFMHINPDPDCVGSVLAFCTFLRKIGKKAYCFSPDTKTTDMMSQKIMTLPNIGWLNKCPVSSFDLSVALDLGERGRLGELAYPTFAKGEESMVIDHHEPCEPFTDYVLREEHTIATCQILYKLMKEYRPEAIDKTVAELLYSGLLTDSGNFGYNDTNAETLLIASELVAKGIDLTEITQRMTKIERYDVFRLKTRVLNNARFFADNKIGLIVFRQQDFLDTATAEKDTDGIIGNIQFIDTVQIAISVAEIGNNRFKISLRSKGNANVAACARTFGGGGHYHAAGCRLTGNFDEVIDTLISAAKKQLTF